MTLALITRRFACGYVAVLAAVLAMAAAAIQLPRPARPTNDPAGPPDFSVSTFALNDSFVTATLYGAGIWGKPVRRPICGTLSDPNLC